MPAFTIVNKRGSRRRRKTRSRRRHRARATNPTRRRRHHNRRRTHARRFHNPRALKFFGVDFGEAGLIVGGMVATGALTSMVANVAPVEQLKSGPGRVALKAGVTVGLAMVGGKFLGRRVGELVALGGAVSVLGDVYKMAQAQFPMLPGMGDYNEVLEDYVPEVSGFAGIGDGGGVGAIPGVGRRPLAAWQQ